MGVDAPGSNGRGVRTRVLEKEEGFKRKEGNKISRWGSRKSKTASIEPGETKKGGG